MGVGGRPRGGQEVVPMTGAEETGAEWESIVERYTVAKDAALSVAVAVGPRAESRSELVLAALVALMDSVGDVPVLLRALRASRFRAANLAAAGRATLAADRE